MTYLKHNALNNGQAPEFRPSPRTTHFNLVNEGSIVLLYPVTVEAGDWITEHIPDDAPRFASAIAVESRYITDILIGIEADGLTWSWR
jgi:hypothetical protein